MPRTRRARTGRRVDMVVRLLLVVAAFLLAACATTAKPGATIPDWLRHQSAPEKLADTQPDVLVQRLAEEFSQPTLPDDHLPPERVAAMAVRALEAGRTADGCLLIAAADYRYFQAAERASKLAAQSRADARFAALDPAPRMLAERLLTRQVEVYRDRNFSAQLAECAALMYGDIERGEQIAQIGRQILNNEKAEPLLADLRNRENGRDHVDPATTIKSAQLFKNFLERLSTDSVDSRRAFDLLAALPFVDFQLAALKRVEHPIEVQLLGNLRRYTLRVAAMRTHWPELMHADCERTAVMAVILAGLCPPLATEDQLAALSRDGMSPGLHDALLFARATRGDDTAAAQIVALLTGSETLDGKRRDMLSFLLHWLPVRQKLAMTPEQLTALLENAGGRYESFAMALALIAEMAPKIGLSGPGIQHIIKRLEMIDEPYLVERMNAALAALPGLDSRTVWQAIGRFNTPRQRTALIARLTRIATEKDLEALALYWRHHPDPAERQAVADCVAAIGTKAAAKQLLDWFTACDQPAVCYRLALDAALLGSSDAMQLVQAVNAKPGDYTPLVLLLRDADAAGPRLQAMLADPAPTERYNAATAIARLRATGFEAQLWQLAASRNDRIYPNDAILRHAALTALLNLAMSKS